MDSQIICVIPLLWKIEKSTAKKKCEDKIRGTQFVYLVGPEFSVKKTHTKMKAALVMYCKRVNEYKQVFL